MNQTKLKVGILGATGMVGQRFVTLLASHPWYEVVVLAASPSSAGKSYKEAVAGKWNMSLAVPQNVAEIKVMAVEEDLAKIAAQVDLVFCALDMEKDDIIWIENAYAGAEVAVISNNSANRWTSDVPMIMPELNGEHAKLIEIQRKKRGWKRGLIAVKPNCSIQSYASILTALAEFGPTKVEVCSLQAISGAGKTFKTWPEMVDNVIPLIGGEEEKSEKEPMRIWGKIEGGAIKLATLPRIGATCIRVPVTNGHMASVGVNFTKKVTKEQILAAITRFGNPLAKLELPTSPRGNLITYFEEENRPQTGLDRDHEHGMGITMGRLRPGVNFDWQFIALSHNTIRGAAGGAVLMAEYLTKMGYVLAK
ncbi:MAG: aspartate-semialdehyde dehydrogenase [bacterium]